jgi:hypothetical protein
MRKPLFGALLLVLAPGCGGLMGSTPAPELSEPSDPTPLARCKVAASANNPLVTEWPASEKAHLQSLVARQAVAVEYTGCELRIIPECKLPGRYVWNRTTLSTDTLEIRNADELFAKLPIGAIGLEGELERSGRLAVHTTVAGQLRLESMDEAAANQSCRKATHVVTAISVGTFMLSSGQDASASGGAQALGVGAGARSSREKSVLRTAGDATRCAEGAEEAPNLDCASPIQLFLTRLGESPEPARRDASREVSPDLSSRGDASEIAFAAPPDGATWTLRDADGATVCVLPCTTSVPRLSGYSLRREKPLAEIELPAKLTLNPGSRATATYQAERGEPFLSSLGFYFVGLPTAAVAVGFGIWGSTTVGKECEDPSGRPDDCFPSSGMLFATAAINAVMSGAALGWYLYSQEADLTITPTSWERSRGPSLGFGPGWVHGSF